MPANFQLQQENGIFIKSWVGDTKDAVLKDIASLLIGKFYSDIAKNKNNDIRQAIKNIRDAARKKKEEENPLLNLSV